LLSAEIRNFSQWPALRHGESNGSLMRKMRETMMKMMKMLDETFCSRDCNKIAITSSTIDG
jgi:hypothetical protein